MHSKIFETYSIQRDYAFTKIQ
jgi:hypothetical protein